MRGRERGAAVKENEFVCVIYVFVRGLTVTVSALKVNIILLTDKSTCSTGAGVCV